MVSTEEAIRVDSVRPVEAAPAQDDVLAHGGDRVAAALAAHGVTAIFTLTRRPHLAHSHGRESARHPHHRHAGRGGRSVCRRCRRHG